MLSAQCLLTALVVVLAPCTRANYTVAIGQGRRAALWAALGCTFGIVPALLGATFMAMTFVVFALYGAFAASARRLILGSERTMAWLNRSFAGVCALLAGPLARDRA